MPARRRGPLVASAAGAVALALLAAGLLGGAPAGTSSVDGAEPASTSGVVGPLVAEQPRSSGAATSTRHEVRLPTTTTPGPYGLPDPAGSPTNVPLTPPRAAVRPVTDADRPPAEVVLEDPDPTLPAKAFDLVPSVRTGAGVGKASDVSELVAEDGMRMARATIALDDPASWRDVAAVFDPIFAAAGFHKVEAVGQDEANLEYRRVVYQRSSLACHVLYDAALGPFYRVLCAG